MREEEGREREVVRSKATIEANKEVRLPDECASHVVGEGWVG